MNPIRILLIAVVLQTNLPAGAKPVLPVAGQKSITLSGITLTDKAFTDIAGLTATRMPDHAVIISWTTEKEGKDDYFEVERSLNGKDWITIAVALAGTGIENNSYEYIDKNVVESSLYYRIKQRSEDGKYSFSAVTTVKGETRAAASILFADKNISIRLYGGVKDTLEVSLLDQEGHVLQQRKYDNRGAIIRFSVADQAPGRYTVNVRDGIGMIGSKKLVFQ